jgi:hypothetical protein
MRCRGSHPETLVQDVTPVLSWGIFFLGIFQNMVPWGTDRRGFCRLCQ